MVASSVAGVVDKPLDDKVNHGQGGFAVKSPRADRTSLGPRGVSGSVNKHQVIDELSTAVEQMKEALEAATGTAWAAAMAQRLKEERGLEEMVEAVRKARGGGLEGEGHAGQGDRQHSGNFRAFVRST